MASDRPERQKKFTKAARTVKQQPGESFQAFIERLADAVEAEEQKEKSK